MIVKVCVSTTETPSIASNLARNSPSGWNPKFSHFSNFAASKETITYSEMIHAHEDNAEKESMRNYSQMRRKGMNE